MVFYYVLLGVIAAFVVVCIDYYRIHCMLVELHERIDFLEDIYNEMVPHLNLMEVSNGRLLPLLEKFRHMIEKGDGEKGDGET